MFSLVYIASILSLLLPQALQALHFEYLRKLAGVAENYASTSRFIPEMDTVRVFYPADYSEVSKFYFGDWWRNDDDDDYDYPLFYDQKLVIRFYYSVAVESGEKVEEEFSVKQRQLITDAIDAIEDATCLKFMLTTIEKAQQCFSDNKWVIEFYMGKSGGPCHAERVGRHPYAATTIVISGNCVNNAGTIMHEIMHALGFIHEHNRPDRDSYIEVRWENIERDRWSQYKKISEQSKFGIYYSSDVLRYDYTSVMHYKDDTFSTGGKTMKAINYTGPLGTQGRLSMLDKQKLNMYYGCHRYINIYHSYKENGTFLYYFSDNSSWGYRPIEFEEIFPAYINSKSQILPKISNPWEKFPIKGCTS